MSDDGPEVERTVRVATGRLPDLDSALAWCVQAIEREGLVMPHVSIEPYSMMDTEDPEQTWRDYYQCSVAGKATGKRGAQ